MPEKTLEMLEQPLEITDDVQLRRGQKKRSMAGMSLFEKPERVTSRGWEWEPAAAFPA